MPTSSCFDQTSAGNTSTIQNFSSAKGDKIALDTTGSAILAGNTYDLGGAALVAADLTSAADAAARLASTLSNGGKGGFVYQQDTGELYYSRQRELCRRRHLGRGDRQPSTRPWTFDATSFTQV